MFECVYVRLSGGSVHLLLAVSVLSDCVHVTNNQHASTQGSYSHSNHITECVLYSSSLFLYLVKMVCELVL